LSEEKRRRGADDLLRAERERAPIRQLSKTFPAIEITDAYRIPALEKSGSFDQMDHQIRVLSAAGERLFT
jgi:2-keto-4-pentenoate hydratase